MPRIKHLSDRSLITIILPQQRSKSLLKKVFQYGALTVSKTAGRGMLISRRTLFSPWISPLLDIFQMIVSDDVVDDLMDQVVKHARLFIQGNGAVFHISLPSFYCHEEESLYIETQNMALIEPEEQEIYHEIWGIPPSIVYQKNVSSISCIVQQGKAENLAKMAMNLGAPGPYISFVQGTGLRDWLGLLRIAINPNRELIEMVAGQFESHHIFEALVDEGKLYLPGMGFIYTQPVKKALMNLPSTIDSKHAASMEQVIKAIDEIKGGTTWRIQDYMDYELKMMKRQYLTNQTLITIFCEWGMGEDITQAAISAGAPGSTLSLVQEYSCSPQESSAIPGVPVSNEKERIEIVCEEFLAEGIIKAILHTGILDSPNRGMIYTASVPKVLTYLGDFD